MSELTRCNYCDYNDYVRIYPRVVVVPEPSEYFPRAVAIHVWQEEGPNEKNRVAWFAELSDHCVC